MDPITTTTTTVIANTTHITSPHGYAMGGKITLTAVAAVFTVSLLVVFIHLYLRWHLHPRQSLRLFNGRRREQPVIAVPRGLDPMVLNSLPTLAVSSGREVADCAVCLTEFNSGEAVRVLPRCDHRFHVECIDMWFGSHNSCPLCRSAVELPPSPSAAVAVESSSESGSGGVIRIQIRDGEEPEPEPGPELALGSGSGSGEKSRLLAILRLLSRREVGRS